MQSIVGNLIPRTNTSTDMTRFSHVVDVSTDLYFSNLLQFLEVSWLQSSITQGIIHSMTSGTESLVRVSRLALIRSISDRSSSGISARILHILVTLLEGSYADDRQAVPLLETIAFVMEQLIELRVDEYEPLSRRLWNIVRKAHFKSTNVRKLDAAVSIYRTLAREGSMRKNGLCKLRDMLLHPYPSVSCFPFLENT